MHVHKTPRRTNPGHSLWPHTTQQHSTAQSVVQLVRLFTDQCMDQQRYGRGRTMQTPYPTPRKMKGGAGDRTHKPAGNCRYRP